jgi:hypothetical protein
MNTVLLAAPLIVFALVLLLGFTGCWLDTEGRGTGDGPTGQTGPNGGPVPLPYADEVLASAPIAYWRLSDPVGSVTAEDEIGSPPSGDHPGEYQGNVELGQLPSLNLSNPVATPARFDGESVVEVVHDPVFETSEFTVEALVQPTSVVSPGVIVGSWSSSGTVSQSQGWALAIEPPGDAADIEGFFAAVVSDGSGSGPVGPSPVAFDLDKLDTAWHLAMTYDGTVLTLYWDGAPKEWGSFSYAPNTQEPLWIGVGVKGAIQEVAVYDRALTAAEIATHYSSNTPPDQNL